MPVIHQEPISYLLLLNPVTAAFGEGAGYVGGITSAACDGIKIADKIFEKISKTPEAGAAVRALAEEVAEEE